MPSVLPCPSCGADVRVRSSALPYVTCGHCHTLVRREGDGLTAIGEAATLPFDVSPLQLGTTGKWENIDFTIVGRVRWGWADGSWNEWALECSDGKTRWLGEAMGMFMLTAERPELLKLDPLRGFATGAPIARGTLVPIDNEDLAATDLKEAECLGSEGDLPVPTRAGRKLTSIDFRGPSGAVLSLQRDAGGVEAWYGQAVDLVQLKPCNLRLIEGWRFAEGMG